MTCLDRYQIDGELEVGELVPISKKRSTTTWYSKVSGICSIYSNTDVLFQDLHVLQQRAPSVRVQCKSNRTHIHATFTSLARPTQLPRFVSCAGCTCIPRSGSDARSCQSNGSCTTSTLHILESRIVGLSLELRQSQKMTRRSPFACCFYRSKTSQC